MTDRAEIPRPKCPTCMGTGRINVPQTRPCPDCTDGFMPLDVWVGKLLDALRDLARDAATGAYITKSTPSLAEAHAVLALAWGLA